MKARKGNKIQKGNEKIRSKGKQRKGRTENGEKVKIKLPQHDPRRTCAGVAERQKQNSGVLMTCW